MKLRYHATLLGLGLLSACATPRAEGPAKANAPSDPIDVTQGPEGEASSGTDASAVEAGSVGAAGGAGAASAQPAVAIPASASAARKQDRASDPLAILPRGFWADPRFQKRFRESYLAVSDVEPPLPFEQRALLEELIGLVSAEQYDEALAFLEEETTPQSSANFDFVRGNIGFQIDDYELAVQGYEDATNKYPRYLRAWKNLGLLRAKEGESELAAQALTRVLTLGGSDEITYGGLGAAYLSNGNPVSAESAFRNAVMLNPAEEQWQLGLARAFFDQARYAEAASLCGSLIEQSPSRADFWLLQANAYLGMKETGKAAENFEFVERLGASTEDSMLLLGDIYTNMGVFDLANAAYARGFALADGPNSDRVLLATQRMIGKQALDEANAALTLVAEAYPDGMPVEVELEVQDLKSRIAVATGDTAADIAALERTIELDPLDGQALILLGEQRRRANEPEEAEFLFDRAIALEEFEGDASLAKAKLLVDLERYDEALPLLERANELSPSSALENFTNQVKRLAKQR